MQAHWSEVNICPMEPEQIIASAVRDADVLIVRTRTKADAQLLADSSVKMVCTATIGYDHIDTAYCDAHGIRWISCPGCNAQAVCNYIEEAIEESSNLQISNVHTFRSCLQAKKSQIPTTPVVGVVGVGHVGSLVAAMAERKGMKVLLNDPPKGIGVSLDEIAKNCDIITFHVPLITNLQLPITNHQYPTHHLCDEAFLKKCKPSALIINAARGGVVDEQALLRSGHPFILDTWENEPHIDPTVASMAFRASMHIAGYSVEGKRNASQMCLDAISEAFSLPRIDLSECRYIDPSGKQADSLPGWLSRISEALKAAPASFETLRKTYPLR